MNPQIDIALAALPVIAAWVWWVDKKVAGHDAIIKKLDQLVDLLLEERLAQSQNRRQAEESNHRGGYR